MSQSKEDRAKVGRVLALLLDEYEQGADIALVQINIRDGGVLFRLDPTAVISIRKIEGSN